MAACAVLLMASGAVARPLPSRQELNPARSAPQGRAAPRDVLSAVEPGPCPLRSSPIRLTLTSVEFRQAVGDRPLAVSAKELKAAYADLLNSDQPVGVICDIRDRAAQIYFRRGVLARVEIPEQRVADGHLVLQVVEARIVSVRYHGDAGPSQPLVESYLEKLRGMAPFDLNVAQRYLLLASDVPGVRLNVALRPSAEGRGAVDMDIRFSRDSADAVVSAQNYGSKDIGREGVLARVDLNSFTPFGERTSLIAYSTATSDEQRVVQLLEQARLGSQGLTGDLSLAYAETRPGGLFSSLDLNTKSFVGSIDVTYPLIRHRRRNLNLAAGLDVVNQTVEFGGGATLTDDRLRVLFARAEGDWTPAFLTDHSVRLSGALEVRKGLNGLGASKAGAADLSRPDGKPDAWVVRGALRGGGVLVGWLTGQINLEGQYTDQPLLAYEEFAVGNLTIGRGYDPSVTSGDRALAGSVELSTTRLPLFRDSFSWRPYVFYDMARVENLEIGGDNRTLRSYGGGVRAQITQRVRLDIAWAEPLDKPLSVSTSKPPGRLLVSLVATLF